VTNTQGESGRRYRLPLPNDKRALKRAADELQKIRNTAPEDVPDEPLPYLRSIFNIHLLDVTKWSSLFTPRQLVSLVRLTRLVRKLAGEIGRENYEPDLRAGIVTCLSLAVDRVAAQFSSLSWWQPKGEFVVGTFGRQALGIVWDFAEIRPVGGASGDLDGAIDWIARVIQSNADSFDNEATVEKANATNVPLPDDCAAAVVTDPPYYDAVPYADLSDFFYVFLKRMLKEIHPTLFGDELTQKDGEIVQLAERNPIYAYKTKEYFEQGMHDALLEARRITVPEGILVVVFAHKTTQGWEVMLSSIISAGWTVTASWPIDTERAVRMRASNSAALGSSVHLVCRPREKSDDSTNVHEIGDWRDVLQELPRRIHEWMPRLAEEGVVGADAIFACLGPALEIFSRYTRVEKASGETVSLNDYLEQVWAAVAKEALAMIFTGADATGFEGDARLTAMWLWTLSTAASNGNGGGTAEDEEAEEDQDSEEDEEDESKNAKSKVGGFVLEYDAARKIAQGLGAHLEQLASLIEVKGSTARLLPVAERTRSLFQKGDAAAPIGRGKAKKKSAQLSLGFVADLKEAEASGGWDDTGAPHKGETVLDRVHQSMILFGAGRGEALKRFLVDDGVGRDDRFWRLAQAFSALYPSSTDEKRWVDGVLARKKSLGF
jgi:adenine-specific DNA methylase